MAAVSTFTKDEANFLDNHYINFVEENKEKIINYLKQNVSQKNDPLVAQILENFVLASFNAYDNSLQSANLDIFIILPNVYVHEYNSGNSGNSGNEQKWCLFQTKLNRKILSSLYKDNIGSGNVKLTSNQIKIFEQEMRSLVKPLQDILYYNACLKIRKTSFLMKEDLKDFIKFIEYVGKIKINTRDESRGSSGPSGPRGSSESSGSSGPRESSGPRGSSGPSEDEEEKVDSDFPPPPSEPYPDSD
jgi:hypothetical protein